MTSRLPAIVQRFLASVRRDTARNGLLVVCGYVALYVFLDRISYIHALPGGGFTLWNPPPAASLALLVFKGLRFAPALFVAGVTSDILVIGIPLDIRSILATDALIAAGYVGVAAGLRRVAHADQGLRRIADVGWLLLIVGVGTAAVAALVVIALVALHELPLSLSLTSLRHFFIGDFTGIIGLLPVFLTMPRAWDRWKEASPTTRAFDIGVFALGLGVALSMVFGTAPSIDLQFYYLLLPPIVWIGVRHGLPWCAIVIFVEQIAFVSTLSLLDYEMTDFLSYQILFIAVAITGLILGAVVTERQQAELNLRERQAALSRMARLTTADALGAALVHEISQPLAIVATYIHACRSLLTSAPVDFDSLSRTMADVESEVRRAGQIVERIRNFVGKSQPRWSSIDVAEVINDVVGALADEARSHGVIVGIDVTFAPHIAADRIQIEQVLVNLIRNAIEAAADSGERENRVRIHLGRVNDEVRVDVEDNGRGVRADMAEHLFKPFETSKQHGMGLGLSLSREIVVAHGGSLYWDAAAAAGTHFVLRLPCDGVERP